MKCPKCSNHMHEVKAEQVGGLPGVPYAQCPACGYTTPIVKRETNRENLRRIKR